MEGAALEVQFEERSLRGLERGLVADAPLAEDLLAVLSVHGPILPTRVAHMVSSVARRRPSGSKKRIMP